ncbi:MAG: AMMECR1 domain-containing protein, partial [Candidatus Latescibacterota bacterium]
WKDVELEISVLTPSRPIRDPDEIVPGRDGVVLQKGGKSAVFLPQVATEQGWSREEMLDHLSRKAGLPAGAWREGATFSVFQAEVFSEKDVE